MRHFCIAGILLSLSLSAEAQSDIKIELLQSGVDSSFRAIAVVDADTVFVGGSNGTLVRSTDSGASWKQLSISVDASELDFRDIEATSDGGLVLMSAGPGQKSRIYRSDDHGDTWKLVHTNRLPKGFFNGVAFWKNGVGLAIGDPIDGRLFLLKTKNFGRSWQSVPGPKLGDGEFGFAASGTGVVTSGDRRAWVATGAAVSRIFRTTDNGVTWQASTTDVRSGQQSSGIFSVAVSESFAVAVGGDYQKPELSKRNCAFISLGTGQETWKLMDAEMPHKACVRFLSNSTALAVGRTGVMSCTLPKSEWKTHSLESFYTFDYDAATKTAFMAGADGRIGRLKVGDYDLIH